MGDFVAFPFPLLSLSFSVLGCGIVLLLAGMCMVIVTAVIGFVVSQNNATSPALMIPSDRLVLRIVTFIRRVAPIRAGCPGSRWIVVGRAKSIR